LTESSFSPAAIDEEYALVLEQGGMGDVSGRLLLQAEGPDTLRYLHNFTTADFKNRAVGDVVEGFVTTDQGRTKAFGVVSVVGRDRVYFDLGATPAEQILAHFEKYIIVDQIQWRNVTAEVRQLVLFGARAEAVLEQALRELGYTEAGLPRGCWSDGTVLVYRGGFPGVENAWHLVLPRDCTLPAALQGLRAVSKLLLEAVRIEQMWPESGIEVTDEHFPQEFRRDDRAISFTKGCYLGQETVARIHTYGHVNRYLVRILFEGGEPLPEAPVELLDDEGRTVGLVTTVAYVPSLKGVGGLGFVRRGHETVGTALSWRAAGTTGRARVW